MASTNGKRNNGGNGAKATKREVLPLPDTERFGTAAFDAKEPGTSFPPIERLRPPKGAPNVLIVLLDDVGFGAASAFGGPVSTPTAERLARGGLKYTRFHTTALCSPTRQCLLTGRNHHSVGMGCITELATSAPGYSSVRPNTKAALAQTLKLNGYSTAQFGKCHEVPVWETSAVGPFRQWPTGSGFEHFYGFLGGETNQYYPAIYEGTNPVEPGKTPEEGYHFTEDMTDKAIGWIRQQKALAPDVPFFTYFAPGAAHAPHHVPREWADKYKGKFDQGWDRLREETFARQKTLGVIPKDAELTAFNAEIPHWKDTPDELKPVLAREMEVYAGFLEHTDYHVGRLIDAIEELGILDDTLVLYILGDNGASAEGTHYGTFNEFINFNGASALETPEFLRSKLDELGSPSSFNHYATGWAHALCTPYQWTKQVASHWGGTRNGMLVHWPNEIRARGEIRTQFHHVVDIAPTILEAARLPEPTMVDGVDQAPMEGTSLFYSFDDANAPERHDTQYFEMMGNRGIYHKGWTAVTIHRVPWIVTGTAKPFDEDVWELYADGDWTQARDVASEHADKLRELQRLWLIEAARYGVLPMDDRVMERADTAVSGRPALIRGRTQILYEGMQRLTEHAVLNIKNRSHSVSAQIEVGDRPAEGVIIAQGGGTGGWTLYAKGGRLKYCYNFLGLQHFYAEGKAPIPAGQHLVRMEFAYDGGGLGKGGKVTLLVDGKAVGTGAVGVTQAILFSADETCDVGRDTGSPTSPDYPARTNAFNGRVRWVKIELEGDEPERPATAEQNLKTAKAAMARQ